MSAEGVEGTLGLKGRLGLRLAGGSAEFLRFGKLPPASRAGVLAAGLGKVWPAAAAAADEWGYLLHDLPRMDARDEVLGDRHDDRHAFRRPWTPMHNDPGLDAVAVRVRQLPQLVLAEPVGLSARRTCRPETALLRSAADA